VTMSDGVAVVKPVAGLLADADDRVLPLRHTIDDVAQIHHVADRPIARQPGARAHDVG